MTARVLIIDPVVTTRIVLKVKLAAAYFQVTDAASIAEAKREISVTAPDLILCETELPDGNAIELQELLSEQDAPVIGLVPENEPEQRVHMLQAGLCDVISRPYNDKALFARIRNVLRARSTKDELKLRANTSAALGFAEAAANFMPPTSIAIIAETAAQGKDWKRALSAELAHKIELRTPSDIVNETPGKILPDALLVAISGAEARQRLDFVSSLRSRPSMRHTDILAVAPPENAHLAITALDTGAGDAMASGFEAREAALRLNRLLTRRSEEQALRRSLEAGLEAAVKDPLTGLFNRRYALPYLNRMAESAERSGRCFALMLLDLDHFKRINDTYGHSVGDAVLREFAVRISGNLRSMDLIARIGGEEFLVAMPDTTLEQAQHAANRLCALTRAEPFACEETTGGVEVSVSVGLALGGQHTPTPPPGSGKPENAIKSLIAQADHALYDAKAAGRDMVRVCRTAA
ncbi:MAG: diguanylate cyclase [Pseudomonadota bacterium]